MEISVLTPSYPTRAEPYRGAAIWALLRGLGARATVRAYCSYPRYFPPVPRHPNFVHDAPRLEGCPTVSASTLRFPAVPGVTRPLNGWLLSGPLHKALAARRPDVAIGVFVYPEGDAVRRACLPLGVPFILVSLGSDLKLLSPHPCIRAATRTALARAARVLAVSEDLCAAARRLGAAPNRVELLPLGVDGAVFRHRPRAEARVGLELAPDAPVILFVGRLVPLKGLSRLLDALALLRAERNCQLVLAGNGSDEAMLRRRVASPEFNRCVRFLGPVAPPEVARWMNAADVLCLPSESEGRPNVLLEALSCGCPVVATPVGGIPELIDARRGLLVREPGPAPLADALRAALDRSWDRAALAGSYHHGWSAVAEQVLAACGQATREMA